MKRLLIFLLLIFLLCGCSGIDYQASQNIEENTNILYSDENGTSYTFDELPIEIEYGSGVIKCTKAELYQEKSEHGYYLYGIVAINLNDLSDDDVYWLDKNKEMNISLMVDNELNELENLSLSSLCITDDYNVRFYIFDTKDEYRYSFDKSNTSMFIRLDNSELFDTYMYSFDTEKVKSTEELDPDLYRAMSNALDKQIEFWKNFNK